MVSDLVVVVAVVVAVVVPVVVPVVAVAVDVASFVNVVEDADVDEVGVLDVAHAVRAAYHDWGVYRKVSIIRRLCYMPIRKIKADMKASEAKSEAGVQGPIPPARSEHI